MESIFYKIIFSEKIFFIYLYIIKIIMEKNKMKDNTKLTTVKIIKDIYSKFKRISFDSNVTLQKVVNRALHRYVEDPEFRKEMNEYTDLHCSGSQF